MYRVENAETEPRTEEKPDLSIEDLLAVLDIYKDTAHKRIETSPDDAPASLMFRITQNSILYLSAYKNSLSAMEKFNEQIAYVKLKYMVPGAPQQ